jgi:hypothetical protein
MAGKLSRCRGFEIQYVYLGGRRRWKIGKERLDFWVVGSWKFSQVRNLGRNAVSPTARYTYRRLNPWIADVPKPKHHRYIAYMNSPDH